MRKRWGRPGSGGQGFDSPHASDFTGTSPGSTLRGVDRNRYWLYDAPLWKDWLVYLTLLGLAAIPGTSPGNAIDWLLAGAVQFMLFAVIPGSIRLAVRSRRASTRR